MQVLEMSPAHAVAQVERNLGLSELELALALSASPRTVSRWRVGRVMPRLGDRRRLAKLVALGQRLSDTFTNPEAAREWMHTPHRLLHGRTPLEAVRNEETDQVEAALEALDSGVFI